MGQWSLGPSHFVPHRSLGTGGPRGRRMAAQDRRMGRIASGALPPTDALHARPDVQRTCVVLAALDDPKTRSQGDVLTTLPRHERERRPGLRHRPTSQADPSAKFGHWVAEQWPKVGQIRPLGGQAMAEDRPNSATGWPSNGRRSAEFGHWVANDRPKVGRIRRLAGPTVASRWSSSQRALHQVLTPMRL